MYICMQSHARAWPASSVEAACMHAIHGGHPITLLFTFSQIDQNVMHALRI